MVKTDEFSGILYLIPSCLGDSDIDMVLPGKVVQIIHSLDHFVVENERTARRFLIRTGYRKSLSSVKFYILDEHTEIKNIPSIFKESGKVSLGLLSEAGVPAVADPGSELVKEAHKRNIKVIPLAGPSSILLALMASGLNGQNFVFHGYLPVKEHERTKRIVILEKRSRQENQAQIFIEAPYRNNQLLRSIINCCQSETILCIAANLTTESEWIKTRTIREWQYHPFDLKNQPAVFVLQS
ncbi:MAG: SAM-dependent methyltransferase [Bacteroidales bacterium]|nr:SAM-dependent methyltransferase [Bacteroidales bacterium]